MSGFLDRLPAPVRHALIAFVAGFVPIVLGAISENAADLGAVNWTSVLAQAISAGFVAAVGVVGVLAGTSLTQQYGYSSGTTDQPPGSYTDTPAA